MTPGLIYSVSSARTGRVKGYVWIAKYVPPSSPPPAAVMDSMPFWEYGWWMDWIERRHGAS